MAHKIENSRVAHIQVDDKGMTKLLVSFSIGTRAGLNELSERLGLSQANLIRSAVAKLIDEYAVPPEPAPAKKTRTRKAKTSK